MRRPLASLAVLALAACGHSPPTADHPILDRCEERSHERACDRPVTTAAAPTPPPAAPTPAPRSPALLATLLADHDRLVAANADAGEIARLRDEIARVAGQRDAHVSRLYWYTDLEEAKAEAQRTQRPILSLHLLGHLDEELSCANSRLFRIVLYSNESVSQLLRDKFVLHWTSERPVPQMTLDFGDGRVVKRTITGNSVHYVLDSHGRILDALPGLYGPAPFAKGLEATLDLAKKSDELSDDDAKKAVAKFHEQTLWRLTASWRKTLIKAYGAGYEDTIKVANLPGVVSVSAQPDPLYASLPAEIVNQMTMSKGDNEAPPLALMQPQIWVGSPWDGWEKIAKTLPAEKLDARSRALLESKHPRDWSSIEAKDLDGTQIDKRVARFEKRLAEEEARNEYVLHAAIHQRLAKATRVELGPINDYVYTKLFMTPKSDAWLGLMPIEAITGIADDGILAKR